MHLYAKNLEAYCESHSTPVTELLHALERETHLKMLAPQMLSGPLQGQLLRMLTQLVRPKTALEIGTFTGYSALCIAGGLPSDAQLHTIEANPELEYLIRKYIDRAGFQDHIHLHIGRAEHIIPTLETSFDLVFIDAGKQYYNLFFDLIIDRVNPGGLILADNVLWSGKVLDPGDDPDAVSLHAFNEKVSEDTRVEVLMLPLRDGLTVMRKREG